MTEPNEAAEPTAEKSLPPELELEFQGRKMWVRMPSPEQLLVWKRTLVQLQGADVSGWNGEQVMKALERTRMIIDSLLVNKVDVEWLDDEMLAGRMGLMDTAGIINGTVDLFAEAAQAEGNRETRRAAKKPGKKAVRKAPSSR
jgi:hypothetical protein